MSARAKEKAKASGGKGGKGRGVKPPMSRDFAKGDPRTVEAGRKGGRATAEKVARFRSLREAALALRDLRSAADPALSNGAAVIDAMYRTAASGDSRCAAFLASLMGEMVEKVDVQNLPVIRDDVPRAPDPPQGAAGTSGTAAVAAASAGTLAEAAPPDGAGGRG